MNASNRITNIYISKTISPGLQHLTAKMLTALSIANSGPIIDISVSAAYHSSLVYIFSFRHNVHLVFLFAAMENLGTPRLQIPHKAINVFMIFAVRSPSQPLPAVAIAGCPYKFIESDLLAYVHGNFAFFLRFGNRDRTSFTVSRPSDERSSSLFAVACICSRNSKDLTKATLLCRSTIFSGRYASNVVMRKLFVKRMSQQSFDVCQLA